MNTAELVDKYGAALRQCELRFDHLGRVRVFGGPIATVRTFEDSVLLKSALERPGDGRVMIVDGAGSCRSALVGINMVNMALENGWAGLIVHGAIRDSILVDQSRLPVCTLHRSPMRGSKLGIGTAGVVVSFGNVDFAPGHYVYADDDGIVVSAERLDP